MTDYQCPALANYAALWLQFRDADLRAEIVTHRDTCEVCTALREATIERRERMARDLLEQSQKQSTADSAGVLSDVLPAIVPGEGEAGRVCASVGTASGRADWSVRADSAIRFTAGEPAEREVTA
jgi:hypothetical protein